MLSRILELFGRPRRSPRLKWTRRAGLIGYRCYAGQLKRIPPASASAALPSLPETLVAGPGLYSVDGEAFNLAEDGVYRFYRLPGFSAQRIVCRPDVEAFLRCAGYLWTYGFEDDQRPPESQMKLAGSGRVILTCSNLSLLCVRVCSLIGIEARAVAMLTLDEWNGQDDGHTLVELRSGNAPWFAYDPSFNTCFRRSGRRLNVMEICAAVRRGEAFELERLPGNSGHATARHDGYDYSFWIDERMESPESLRTWYQRVAMLPLVYSGTQIVFPLSNEFGAHAERISTLKYDPVDAASFEERFYGRRT